MEGGEGLFEDTAIRAVCNDVVALPEVDVPGMPLHLPVTWLGAVSDELALDDETYARITKQRLGWRQGPRVMLVLPSPFFQDVESRCALSPSTFGGTFLREKLEEAGFALSDVMVTHAYRFALPSTMKSFKQQHLRSNAPYVIEDIEQCRPQVIVTFGAPALQSVIGFKKKLDSVRGGLVDYTFRDGTTCKIVPTCSHMSFYGSHADLDQFKLELKRAADILKGVLPETAKSKDYRVLTTADQVEALCAELHALAPKRIAFDTEFGNDLAREEFRYTISVQLAWAEGHAAFVQLRKHEPQPDITETITVRNKDGTPKIKKDGTPQVRTKTYNPGPKSVPIMSPEDEARCWKALQCLFLNPKIQL